MKPIIKLACKWLYLGLAFVPLFGEISFLSPDINSRNEVLFSVKADIPGKESYQTLFLHSIDTGTMEQLTFFPEEMESLSGGTLLQIRNRFGTGQYNSRSDTFSWIDDYKPFYKGGTVGFGMLPEVATSPDGRYLVSIEPLTPARGRLVLFDTVKEMRFVLAETIERGAIPVSWAPDASVLVYSIENTLYFARPESFFSATLIDAQYRILGTGQISCISWFSATRMLYVSGTTVYRIQSAELFARSLYSPLIGIGELAGKLPCLYNPSADTFCASPDGNSILFAKDGRSIYYCPLEGDDYISTTRPSLLPYLLLPANTASLSFIWTAEGIPAVFAESVEDGKKTLKSWKLSDYYGGKIFTSLAIPAGVKSFLGSRDGSLLAFTTAQGLTIYNTASWKEVSFFKDETIVSAVWAEDPYIYIGGAETVRRWNYKTGISSVLLISGATSCGWDEQGTAILAETTKLGRFEYSGKLKWKGSSALKMRSAGTNANASWRMYLDSGQGYYTNMLYARSAKSPGGTKPLFGEPSGKLDPLLNTAQTESYFASDVLSRGSRTGYRQVALVFDAMDTLDGLGGILHVLDRYKISATFFINGEFIRQHPAAVNEIVKAGHQCASLFFTTWDLGGTRYRIDEDFIIRGLSRNEDDFYNVTGQELTLLWHAPFYVTSPLIIEAGKKAGYQYVSGDVTVLDWVTADQNRLMPGLFRSSGTLIENIIADKKPGSIIPVRIGKLIGERPDYLYEKIDLLINALTEAGYSIVTVDTLIRNMR